MLNGALIAAAGLALPAANGCELHIWPAPRPSEIVQTWSVNRTVRDGSRDTGNELPSTEILALSNASQLSVLGERTPATSLGLPGYLVVTHPEPLARRAIGAPKVRIAEGAPACYAELIVAKIVLSSDAIAGRTLRALFTVNYFGDGAVAERSFSGWGEVGLDAYSVKGAGVPADALRSAFGSSFTSFAVKSRFAPPVRKP